MIDERELRIAIEQKREEMVQMGLTKGLSHSATVKCSQELDELLNMRSDFYTTTEGKEIGK